MKLKVSPQTFPNLKDMEEKGRRKMNQASVNCGTISNRPTRRERGIKFWGKIMAKENVQIGEKHKCTDL